MLKIDSSSDTIIGAQYDLYRIKFSELKALVLSWYKDVDLKEFDNRKIRGKNDEKEVVEMKKSGLVCNLFFAYQEGDKSYLLDGFNRLLTDYGTVEQDTTVYLKIITTKLEDQQLMEVMYRLNMWKLYIAGHSYGGFKLYDFLDRGFRLLLHSKFGIDFYNYGEGSESYHNRTRNKEDLSVIDQYFVNEADFCADFKTTYEGVQILMSQPNILNDFKAIIKGNDYREEPFKNYHMFLEGYARYLAYLRYKGLTRVFEFDEALQHLYANKAFFKKLQGMSGNDSTRKNIYHFFRELKLEKAS